MTAARTAAVGFGAGLLGAVVGVGVFGAAQPKGKPAAVVEAREFRLVDADGKSVGAFLTADGSTTLAILRNGAPVVSITSHPDEGELIAVSPKDGGTAMLTAGKDGVARLMVLNKEGSVFAGSGFQGSKASAVVVSDKDSEVLFRSNK